MNSSSGRFKPYPPLSVSNAEVVCMLSLLWVQCGMCSIHGCVVYSVRTQDSVVMGAGSAYFQHMCIPRNFEWFMRFVSTSHFNWVAIPHTVEKEWWHPQWGLRTCCHLMNAVQVGDLSLIPCSQWVILKLFACFHSCEYNVGCPACMFLLYASSIFLSTSPVCCSMISSGNALELYSILSQHNWE